MNYNVAYDLPELESRLVLLHNETNPRQIQLDRTRYLVDIITNNATHFIYVPEDSESFLMREKQTSERASASSKVRTAKKIRELSGMTNHDVDNGDRTLLPPARNQTANSQYIKVK